ncbi:MAG: aspartate aminotransferase family protein [Candidatus Omnitrophica bacterium]|nr:aspartate aminotransferase family protein [Candidatus Omnitrophota bacterium]MBI3083432.1 aspartate aminotransferase family protein [Candidatus Omnitrophota bacterium]
MTMTQEVIKQYDRYVMNTYVRSPLVLTKGKGSRVWDVEGREYLDLFPGWGVSGLGHNHPWVTRALRGQSRRIIHVPNNYYHPLQARAAKKLTGVSFDGKVFFCNSGAEAVETAVKLARRWGEGRYEIIVMEQSFHGRTMAALSATGQPKYQEGFEPLLAGFVRVPFNELDAVLRAITPKTCAVLVEPIQGEGGVRVASDEFLAGLRRLCDERKLLLIADEVQTGMGRTGTWFAYQHSTVEPDLLLLAKTLGGGFPIGAVVARRAIADVLVPGTHATTYGGSPLGCACILAVFEAVEKQKLLERVNALGRYAFKRLAALKERAPVVREVRGRGLMVGIELTIDGRPVVDACRAKRLLINCTQDRVLRLLPAMTITKAQLSRALSILEDVLMGLSH